MRITVAALIVFALFSFLMAGPTERHPKRQVAYELYSWQDSNGKWEFALLLNTNRNHTSAEIFDRKGVLRGVADLQQRLSLLPAGTVVFWPRGITDGAGKSLRYPPQAVVQQLQSHARSHKIRLDIVGPVT